MNELIDMIEDLDAQINFIETQIEDFQAKGTKLRYYQKKRNDLIARKQSYEYELGLIK